MTTKRDLSLIHLSRRLDTLGISLTDQNRLRLIELTLSRWAERLCGDEHGNAVERDEVSGKMFASYEGQDGKRHRYVIADKERGALKRLDAIMARYPDLWYYHQTDPRGCALYVGKKAYLKEKFGENVHVSNVYSSAGVAVCL